MARGGHLRRGRVLRLSGGLMSDRDLERLEAAGVRTVADLRGRSEHDQQLTRWARRTGASYVALEIDVARGGQLARAVRDTRSVAEAAELLIDLYVEIVDDYARELGRALTTVSESGPAVICCTAGKDRTGITAALAQLAMGVDEDLVLASYEASPPSVERLRPLVARYLDRDDLHRPQVEVLLGAKASTLHAVLEHIRSRHGGVDRYLRVVAGMEPEALERMRAELVADGSPE